MSKQGYCLRFWSALILILLQPSFLLASQFLIMPEECHEVVLYGGSSLEHSVKTDHKFARILTKCVDKTYVLTFRDIKDIVTPEVRAVFRSIRGMATEVTRGFWGRIEIVFISAYFIEMVDLYNRAVGLETLDELCTERLIESLEDKIDRFNQKYIRLGSCGMAGCKELVSELHNLISVLRGLVRGCLWVSDKASSVKMLVPTFAAAAISFGLGFLLRRLFRNFVFVVGALSGLSVAVAVVAIGCYLNLDNVGDRLVEDLDLLSKGIHEYHQFINSGILPSVNLDLFNLDLCRFSLSSWHPYCKVNEG